MKTFGFQWGLLFLALGAVAEEAVPTHLRVTATFIRKDKDGKDEAYAAPQVVTIDGKQTSFKVGSAEEGIDFTITPKVEPDGSLTLETSTDSRQPIMKPAVQPAPSPLPAKLTPKDYPSLHAVLVADKLFSIENAVGSRKWLPLGAKVDGWTLKSYDAKREALTIARLGRSLELVLNKAVIEVTPPPNVVRSQTQTTVKVLPKVRTVIVGTNGQSITVEAEILDFSK